MIQPVLLLLIYADEVVGLEFLLHGLGAEDLSWVVGSQRISAQSLAEDLVAGPDAVGVERGREELALGLGGLAWRRVTACGRQLPS